MDSWAGTPSQIIGTYWLWRSPGPLTVHFTGESKGQGVCTHGNQKDALLIGSRTYTERLVCTGIVRFKKGRKTAVFCELFRIERSNKTGLVPDTSYGPLGSLQIFSHLRHLHWLFLESVRGVGLGQNGFHFMSNHGLHRYACRPFSSQNVAGNFQHTTDAVLLPVKWHHAFSYLEHIVVFCHSPSAHVALVRWLLNFFKNVGVSIKPGVFTKYHCPSRSYDISETIADWLSNKSCNQTVDTTNKCFRTMLVSHPLKWVSTGRTKLRTRSSTAEPNNYKRNNWKSSAHLLRKKQLQWKNVRIDYHLKVYQCYLTSAACRNIH